MRTVRGRTSSHHAIRPRTTSQRFVSALVVLAASVLAACGEVPTSPGCVTPECFKPPIDEITLIPMTTYDGSGQVVHPDVVVGGDRLSGLWLAITPYPGGNSKYENPSIFDGKDGESWAVPSGLTNPVALPSADSYLSDPDVVFNANDWRLWMFYREVVGGQNVVRVTHSSDGVHWDTPASAVSAPSHRIVSPTVVHGAPQAPWVMWSVNAGPDGCRAAATTVERRVSTDGEQWGPPVTTDLAQPGQVIWHIDVQWIPSRGEYWALYNTYSAGGSCATNALFLARSTDGISWTVHPSPIVQRGIIGAFADIVYRSTFLFDPATQVITLWVSGANYQAASGYTWRLARMSLRASELFTAVTADRVAALAPSRNDLPPPERDVETGH